MLKVGRKGDQLTFNSNSTKAAGKKEEKEAAEAKTDTKTEVKGE
jgi:hypothetical protein